MAQTEPKPIYVIYGPDEFLRDHWKVEITAATLGDADRQMCLSRHAGSAELADVLDDLRTPPFLGPRRLVIVDGADEFVASHRQALEQYLASPSSTGSLLLTVKSFPATTRLAKRVNKIGLMADCRPPSARGAAGFLRDRAKARGRRFDPAAAELMIQWLGPDLARIDSELEKLALYTEGRDNVTVADVSAAVAATGGVSPWALTDSLSAGDARGALETLNKLLTQPGEEYRLLGLIGWHLRRALRGKHMQATGAEQGQILAAILGKNRVSGAAARSFAQLLTRRSLQQVCADFRHLLRADLAMKTGQRPAAALQRLVVQLC